MDWIPDVLKIISLCIAVVASAGSALAALVYAVGRFTKLEQVTYAWVEIYMQDSTGKNIHKGFARMNSPAIATEKAIEIFPDKLVQELREFRSRNLKLTDLELANEIAIRFRHKINKHVNANCPDVDWAQCIASAVLIAKIRDPKSDSDLPQGRIEAKGM